MELTTTKYFRRKLYVKLLLIVMLGVSLAVGAMLWSFPADFGGGYHNQQAILRAIQKVLIWRVAIFCAVTFIIILPAMVSILLFCSHRIAGPTYRLGLEASKIGQGNLAGGIVFRQHDSLVDMADSLNDLAFQYRDRVNTVKASLFVIDELSNSVCDLIRQGNDDAASLKTTAEEMIKHIKVIECSLQEIRT